MLAHIFDQARHGYDIVGIARRWSTIEIQYGGHVVVGDSFLFLFPLLLFSFLFHTVHSDMCLLLDVLIVCV